MTYRWSGRNDFTVRARLAATSDLVATKARLVSDLRALHTPFWGADAVRADLIRKKLGVIDHELNQRPASAADVQP